MIPIANWEDRYALTETGQVINLATNQPMKLRQNPNGYLIVTLAVGVEGQGKQCSVHRLMALHFLPNPYQYTQVNHKDGDKTNNSIGNIEWCSAGQNIRHALKTGLRSGYISANDKDALVQRVLQGELIRDLAIEINRGEESLSGMLRRRAAAIGLEDVWQQNMKRRRSGRTTLRNKGLL